MKKLALLLAIVMCVMSLSVVVSAEEPQEIRVMIKDKLVKFDQPPVIEDGRTLVPLRAIVEALPAAEVDWYEETQTIHASMEKGFYNAKLQIGSNKMQVEIEDFDQTKYEVELDVPAKIINGRTMVPLRAIAEAFDCYVEWIEKSRIVVITYVDSYRFNEEYAMSLYPDDSLEMIDVYNSKNIILYQISYDENGEFEYIEYFNSQNEFETTSKKYADGTIEEYDHGRLVEIRYPDGRVEKYN